MEIFLNVGEYFGRVENFWNDGEFFFNDGEFFLMMENFWNDGDFFASWRNVRKQKTVQRKKIIFMEFGIPKNHLFNLFCLRSFSTE